VGLHLGSEDVLAWRRGRSRETRRRLVRIGVEALGGCIIERLELVILGGGKAVVVFRRGCIEIVGAGGMRVRRRQRRNRHELVVGLRVGEVILPGKIHCDGFGGGG
jgi:hypothetical protein